jgi:hypothetical protein
MATSGVQVGAIIPRLFTVEVRKTVLTNEKQPLQKRLNQCLVTGFW